MAGGPSNAANQLRVTEARRTDPPSLGTAALRLIERDESRYDALGRRVLVSSRRRCYDNNEPQAAVCLEAYVQRTVWAGAQEIYEDRVPLDTAYHTPHVVSGDRTWSQVPELPVREFPGFRFDPNPYFGAVAYAYGEALDQPLMVVRAGYRDRWTAYGPTLTDPVYAPSAFTIFPHWSPQGYANLGTGRDGGQFHCSGGDCTFAIAWGMSWSPYNPTFGRRAAWIGSLLEDKKDANGLLYRRNRYVDPQTGRFTQQDPIGIAGGLNLYGYANGDPVNSSDPFGLFPDCTAPGVVCPKKASTFVRSSELMRIANELYEQSAQDGAERGAYVFRNSDGSFRLGDVKKGKPLEGTVHLGDVPKDAVGEIHTHPDAVYPSGSVLRGGGPSGPDVARAKYYHHYSIVVGKSNVWVIPWKLDEPIQPFKKPSGGGK